MGIEVEILEKGETKTGHTIVSYRLVIDGEPTPVAHMFFSQKNVTDADIENQIKKIVEDFVKMKPKRYTVKI